VAREHVLGAGAGIAGIATTWQLMEQGVTSVVLVDPRPPLTVTSNTCTCCLPGPSFRTAPASSASVVGHTSGQWVKPKNNTTTLPRKSSSERGLPF